MTRKAKVDPALQSNFYNALVQAYTKDIENFKEILKTVNNMLNQKDKELQDFKNKAISLLKTSVGPRMEDTVPKEKKPKKKNQEIVPSGKERKSQAVQQKKQRKSRKGKLSLKDLAAGKMEPDTNDQIEKKVKPGKENKDIMCLYHPNAPAVDKGKHLCSSCKWKLIYNGLLNFDKDPAVISFLKGETKVIPNLGQPMCPVHPSVPAYNKKTGLCQKCQSKAKKMGVTDRQLTEEELRLLRNSGV